MSERGNFGSRLGIVLATAGSAVGLGNVWRFPYMTGQNGGAAFIIIYLVCILLLGIPGMVSEFIVGRHSQTNAARAYASFSHGKAWGLIGGLGIITSTIILGFYAVVAGWCLHYLGASTIGNLKGDAGFVQSYFKTFSCDPIKPAVLGVAFILITHFIIIRGVRNGIERASKLLMPLLFVLLLIIVIASCSLPGALKGVEFLLQAFGKLQQKHPDIKLLIAGSGKLYFDESLYRGNANVALMNRYVPLAQLADLLKNALFTVCPYKDATQSGVVQTAFSMGTPIVATDVGNFAKAVENGKSGVVVPPCDANALAEAMTDLVEHPEKLESFRKYIAGEWLERNGWEEVVTQYLNCYEARV